MFSIIIPCFNKQNQILTTLYSVLNQSFQDYEIIIVDDGSTDNSVNLINTLQDKRIKLIQQQNAGVSIARNKAIKKANGEWVAFLDADDWWHPQYLENINHIIKTHSDAKVVSTDFISKPDTENWQPQAWPLLSQRPEIEIIYSLPEQWLQRIPFCTNSICINKDFLHTIQPWFPESETNGEDLDLWMRIAEKTNILNLPIKLSVYRTNQAYSLTTQHKSLEIPLFIKRMQSRALKHSFPAQLKYSTLLFVAQYKLTLARKAILQQRRTLAFKLLTNATYTIKTKRWWMTLFMILFFPPVLVQKWQDSKKRNQGT